MVWRNGSSTPCRSEEQMVIIRTRKWICCWIKSRASKGSIGVWKNLVKKERASCMQSIFLMLMLLPSSTENTASRLLLLIVRLLRVSAECWLKDSKLLPYLFLKSPRPSLPLKRAPPLTPALSPQERGRKPLLLVARNRYALRLADHQKSRQIVRDGTALLILACELVMTWVLLACGLLMDLLMGLVMAWVLLACGLLMGWGLYRCWWMWIYSRRVLTARMWSLYSWLDQHCRLPSICRWWDEDCEWLRERKTA